MTEKLTSRQRELNILASGRGFKVDKHGCVFNSKGVEVNTQVSPKGYLSFNFRYDRSLVTRLFVHKLQAYQKFGDKMFEPGIVVRHLNGNSKDNSWDNIAIGTQSDNQLDIPLELRRKYASNPKHDHLAVIDDRKNGLSYAEIMIKHGISSKSTVSFIINKAMANES